MRWSANEEGAGWQTPSTFTTECAPVHTARRLRPLAAAAQRRLQSRSALHFTRAAASAQPPPSLKRAPKSAPAGGGCSGGGGAGGGFGLGCGRIGGAGKSPYKSSSSSYSATEAIEVEWSSAKQAQVQRTALGQCNNSHTRYRRKHTQQHDSTPFASVGRDSGA